MSNVTHLKIQENLISDYDVYYLSTEDLISGALNASMYAVLISVAFYNSVVVLVISIPIAIIFPFFMKDDYIKKRKEKLLFEFKDFLRIIKSFLEASYSIENAFALSIREMAMLHGRDSMMVKELKAIVSKLKLNKPLDVVFKKFADKTHIEDIMDFSEVFIIAKMHGGNISKIIGNTINVINDKIEVKIEIDTVTASKRFEQKLMNLLPFLIIIYMNISSSSFLRPLYTTIEGRLLMTFALVVYFVAITFSKKILQIEV
ncbi:MAG: type II secretion system F family protein [Lachnospiraceae bacterium]|nr:type II secretion system F family protein [Lachnospiraceae bacterium]